MASPKRDRYISSVLNLRQNWRGVLAAASLAGGLSLLPLLPIGVRIGINHPSFTAVFLAHAILLLCAVFFSLAFLAYILRQMEVASTFYAALICFFAAIIFIQAGLSVGADEASLQLVAAVKSWSENGSIPVTDLRTWLSYPGLLELGFLGLFHLGLEKLASFYPFLFLLLLCANTAVFVYARSKNASLAAFSFALLFTTPICLKLASLPSIELGAALYTSLALNCAVYWSQEKRGDLWLVAAGAALGLALTCKPSAVLAWGPFFLLLMVLKDSRSFLRLLRAALLCAFMTLLVFSAWTIIHYSWLHQALYALAKNSIAAPFGEWFFSGPIA